MENSNQHAAGNGSKLPLPTGADLLATQARAGLLWTDEDDALFKSDIFGYFPEIPVGVPECDLLSAVMRSTNDEAVLSRVEWVVSANEYDFGSGDDWSYRLKPAVDFCDTMRWPGEEKPRFREEGAATFGSDETARSTIGEVVSERADDLLAWLEGGEESIELTHTFSKNRLRRLGLPACMGVAWNPQTNAIRETWTRTFVVTFERDDEREMGMRVTSARPIAASEDAERFGAELRDVLMQGERPSISIYELYQECRLDPSCPFEVRLYQYEEGGDEACDEVEIRTTDPDGNVHLIAIEPWMHRMCPLTIRGEGTLRTSDFECWFDGEKDAPTEVPESWVELRKYAEAAKKRLEDLERREFFDDGDDALNLREVERRRAELALRGEPDESDYSWLDDLYGQDDDDD
ncbi:MAG: hypothetical protein ACOYJL_09455 [Tractidigestivibacter sp.]|jgi:hypothetical protein|uniref:hypothetical protein n=1 Tax=Tractidigestivibacter sp. TaxID=2847320 RepID=UPI003D92E892